jgi:16S rRNA (cytidine1402-2'-O)-methyltransferase
VLFLRAVRSPRKDPEIEAARGRRGKLVVVGTPIGNLEDLSPRAARVLAEADAIFCEDTRVTAKLATRFGIRAPRISCPAPREASRVGELLSRLGRGETVAMVSDAGMPVLSDPGDRLVDAAASAGYAVEVVPGPSAASAAVAVSGLPAVPHLFLGFLPSRSGERRRALELLRDREETLVWFESPHRLAESLVEAARVLGPRRACVARELTKVHEEAPRGTLAELAKTFGSRERSRGEVTVVVEGAKPAAPDGGTEDELDAEIRRAVGRGESTRDLARAIGKRTGRPARDVYARAVAIAKREPKG